MKSSASAPGLSGQKNREYTILCLRSLKMIIMIHSGNFGIQYDLSEKAASSNGIADKAILFKNNRK